VQDAHGLELRVQRLAGKHAAAPPLRDRVSE
jgi:hypothetical protein